MIKQCYTISFDREELEYAFQSFETFYSFIDVLSNCIREQMEFDLMKAAMKEGIDTSSVRRK